MKVNGLKWASQLCLVSTLFLSLSTVAPNRKHSYRATNLRASEIDGLIKQPDMQIDPRHKSANQCERLTTTRFLCLYQHVYCLVIKQSVRISSPAVSRSQRNHKLFKCTREYNITYICQCGIWVQMLILHFFPSILCLLFSNHNCEILDSCFTLATFHCCQTRIELL